MTCRKNFNLASGHGVCSNHFVGGKKTYESDVPTIVPKQLNQQRLKKENLEIAWELYKKTTNSMQMRVLI